MIAFQHATIITPHQTIPDGTLIASGGKIQAVGASDQTHIPPECRVVDLEGYILAPGFIDIQFNGAFGMDFTENPGSLYDVAAGLPQYGVTAFLPTVITSPLARIQAALQVWQDGPPDSFCGADPLGWHIEGPMLNPAKKGAHNPDYIRPLTPADIQEWRLEAGTRLVTLAPELSGAHEIVRILHERGVVVSAGHSLASYEQSLAAFDAGVSAGTHLFNAMPPLGHRSPGLVGALLERPEVAAGLIVDGIHIHPAIVNLVWRARGPEGLILVTDAMAAMGKSPGRYRLGGYDVIVADGSVRLPDGTLAGSVCPMDACLRNLMAYTGCELNQAINCCTLNPARLLGLADKGRLAPGMDADLAVLTPDTRVAATLAGGQVLFTQIPQLEETL